MSPDTPSAADQIRYHLDRFMSWSPIAKFLGLLLVSTLLVTVCASLALLVMPEDPARPFDFLEAMWWSMTRVADGGTMGGDQGSWVRGVASLATLSGVFVVALLIGLTSSMIGEKFDDLRKGRSPIIDQRHTLILGYGEKIFAILRELRQANLNQRSASIVILSGHDKEEVENAVRERLGDMATTRVLVRQGSPFSPHDLRKVGAGRARSIIIVAGEPGFGEKQDPGQADMAAIKTLLALRRISGALTTNHVVIELLDASRRSVVERLGAGGVEVVAMRETLSRMMVQTARQNGLAGVYRDLLSYEGSEFYFRSFPELAGQKFGVAQWKMKDAVVVGLRRAPPSGPARCLLNPADELVLEASDELLVIAEDDDTFSLSADHRPVVPTNFRGAAARPRQAEKVLVCGLAADLGDILRELDNYVLAGSEAWLMPGRPEGELLDLVRTRAPALKNLSLKYVEGDPTRPEDLKRAALPEASVAMVLADSGIPDEEADARTVITVLLLRELLRDFGPGKPRIISEILDSRTKDLLEQDYGADFVVSSEITSKLLAQVSERRELNAVFADLFDADGNEIYLKQAACFATVGVSTEWLAIQQVARRRAEVAIGYLRAGHSPVINPPQGESLTLAEDDRIIVIAEDDREAPGEATVAQAG